MANQDSTSPQKVVSRVSEPRTLTTAELAELQQESDRLHDAFTERTASMEMITAEDLRVRAR